MAAMGGGFDKEYCPDPAKAALYQKRYEQYNTLGKFIEQKTVNSHE
jgi:L-ribulokinase